MFFLPAARIYSAERQRNISYSPNPTFKVEGPHRLVILRQELLKANFVPVPKTQGSFSTASVFPSADAYSTEVKGLSVWGEPKYKRLMVGCQAPSNLLCGGCEFFLRHLLALPSTAVLLLHLFSKFLCLHLAPFTTDCRPQRRTFL